MQELSRGLKSGVPRLPILLVLLVIPIVVFGQDNPGTVNVRVTVAQNADGSRSTYEFNDANHTAVATTKDKEGNLREKIRYMLDAAGHFQSGEIMGPGEKFRYKSLYKYNVAGKMIEEAHLTREDVLINKIAFHYDAAGRQTGYAVFDANGKLLGQTSPARGR